MQWLVQLSPLRDRVLTQTGESKWSDRLSKGSRALFLGPVIAVSLAACAVDQKPPGQGEQDRGSPPTSIGLPGAVALENLDSAFFMATKVWESGGDALLSYVSEIEINSHAFVYVADPVAMAISVFSPDGRLLRSIGRKGAGPGEFRGIGSIQIGAGDTLFVFDNILRRLTAFRPEDDSVVYSRRIAEQARSTPQRAYRARSGPQLVATFMPPFRAEGGDGQVLRRELVVRVLGPEGSIERDSLLVGVGTSNLFTSKGSSIWVGTNAFGRQPIVRFSVSDQVFYARSDSAVVTVVGLDGRAVRRCALTAAPVMVTRADLARQKTRMSRQLRPVLEDSMPAFWPVLGDFVVDDRDGVWFGLTGAEGRMNRWVLCDRDGVFRGSVSLPLDVILAAVRDSILYGIARDEDQVPTIHAYRFTRSPRRPGANPHR